MEKRTYHLWVSYFDQLGPYKQGSTDSDDRGKSNTTKGSGDSTIAEHIYNFPEVKAVYLMSGGYDFMVMLEGKDGERDLYVHIIQISTTGICCQYSNTFCIEEI